MRLGTMLGTEGQTELKKAVERNERFAAKKARQAREAEINRKRQRGEFIRYPERDK